MNAQQRRNWRSPETRAASLAGLPKARAKAHQQRTKDKIEGMAFARAWREANKGRDWTVPEGATLVCACCGQPVQ
jgi:hypothetical protein